MAICAGAASLFPSILPWKYHVFLSFRGEDTRTGFTGHVHAALQRRGIITFIDDAALETGKDISDQLLRAIQESLISIVILSENYASSRWCLDELQKILESRKSSGREVIPVFYKIDPSDVRNQKGTFAYAFQTHIKRFPHKVQGWRDALKEVAKLSGFDSRNQQETKLIGEIVAKVWAMLQLKLSYCFNNDFVGIDSRIREMDSLLMIGLGDVRLIGIWGMSGIGKTTLARIMYERICGQYDISCFLDAVKENSKTKGLVHLQGKLLSKLNMKSLEVHDAYEGKNIIRNLLCSKKVLVVLDDVSEISQLENFSIKQAWLGPGSRVIVTTKDLHILTAHGEFQMYKPKLLNCEESLELLCKRAFKSNKPTDGYLKLSKSAIDHAEGHTLTLEVLGSHLCGRTKLEWKDALEKVKKLPPSDILRRLRIHYEALDDMEKKIFLDMACFCKGMAKDEVTQIFEICGFHPTIGIRELVEKCLITEYWSDQGVWHLGMHNVLQEMGKSVVYGESPSDAGRRSRLWSPEDIHHVMTKNKGSDLIEVINLQSTTPCEANWNHDAFSMMCNLRILIISCDVYLPGGLKCLPSSLKILKWNKYPLKSLPPIALLDQLVDLKLHHSNIIQLWEMTQMSENLKFIDLSYSKDLIRTPDFSVFPNLEQLILEGCIKLVQVHQSLGQHKKLIVLNLKNCKTLKVLPSRMEMDLLQKLILSSCVRVKKLPEFGENMNNLSVVDVKNCHSLLCLPSSICNLRSLRILSISGCSKFSSLPQNLGEIECLEELDISGTAVGEITGLTSNPLWKLFSFGRVETSPKLVLPPSISGLSLLKELNMSKCNLSVGSIPNDLGCLSSLEVLNLSGNNFGNLPAGTCALPPSFSSLSTLKILNLSDCHLCDGSIPDDLSGLSSLKTLYLSSNTFTNLPARFISNLLCLRVLHLSHCKSLKLLPTLPPNLKHVDANSCHSLPKPVSFAEHIYRCSMRIS